MPYLFNSWFIPNDNLCILFCITHEFPIIMEHLPIFYFILVTSIRQWSRKNRPIANYIAWKFTREYNFSDNVKQIKICKPIAKILEFKCEHQFTFLFKLEQGSC